MSAQRRNGRQKKCGERGGVSFLLSLMFLLGLSVAVVAMPARGEKPMRIVSINLSADQLLLQLVEPERIAAVSLLALDPEISQLADRAAGVPTTKGSAEEVLRLQPDLVLAGEFANRATTDLLRKLGIPVLELPEPTTFDEIRDLLAHVAEALGEPERGRLLIEEMDRRLEVLRVKVEEIGDKRPSVLSCGQSGYTQGADSLMNAIIKAAGFRNAAMEFGLNFSGNLTLEALLLAPPDFLVFSPFREEHATLGGQWLHHRALSRIRERMKIIEIPMAEVISGNNLTVEASEKLWLASRQLIPREKE